MDLAVALPVGATQELLPTPLTGIGMEGVGAAFVDLIALLLAPEVEIQVSTEETEAESEKETPASPEAMPAEHAPERIAHALIRSMLSPLPPPVNLGRNGLPKRTDASAEIKLPAAVLDRAGPPVLEAAELIELPLRREDQRAGGAPREQNRPRAAALAFGLRLEPNEARTDVESDVAAIDAASVDAAPSDDAEPDARPRAPLTKTPSSPGSPILIRRDTPFDPATLPPPATVRAPGVISAPTPPQPEAPMLVRVETPGEAPLKALREIEPPQVVVPPRLTTPAQEIAVRIGRTDAPAVDVQLVQRAGQVRVDVRTHDPVLQASLRQDLSTLVNSLERTGYRTETFVPAESPRTLAFTPPAAHGGESNMTGYHHRDQQREQQQQQQRQRRQPEPEFEIEEAAA